MLATPLLLLANERPLINVDLTILVVIGLWLALFFFLKATFWKPILAVIDAREEGTEGLRKEARRLEAEARKVREDFDLSLRKAREAVAAQREKLQQEGHRQEAEILQGVRDEVNKVLAARHAEVNSQRDKLRAELRATVPALASDIAARLLRREVRA